MEAALLLVGLAVGVLAGTAVARRLDVPAPLLLAAAGAAASYVPGVPTVELEAEVVLLGLLPPLLYAAALKTSLVDFATHRRPILLLSVALVVVTTVAVGAVAVLVVPGLPWWAGLALGAVVAPPDAVAATAIARRIGLPRRVVTILEGESLLNDATALVSLRTAIAAGSVGVGVVEVGLDFLLAAGGGALVGGATYAVVAAVRRRTTDPVFDSAVSLVVPFAAFVAAEEVHASGVIAVVVAGLLLGHRAPVLQSAQARIAERLTWRTVTFLLENAVFLLIGLQTEALLADVAESDLGAGRVVLVCVLVLLTVVGVRLAWVFPARYVLERPGRGPVGGQPRQDEDPPWSYTFVVGWAGMRGVVTLAAAFVLPEDTPQREVLLLAAFSVVAGTLFLQGASLPWVARRLRVPGPDPREDALARATLLQQATKAATDELDRVAAEDGVPPGDPHGVVALLRQRLDQRSFAAWERLATVDGQEAPSDTYARVRLHLLAVERERVLEIRSSGRVAAEVVDEVLALLDVEESLLESAQERRAEMHHSSAQTARSGDGCADLDAFPAAPGDPGEVCADCVRDRTAWVALRRCLACGEVRCCDSSAGQHATEHFHATGHPVMASAEPGEDWRWCYVHHASG